MREAARTAAWVGLAADLVSERAETWQAARINRQLVETFGAVGGAFCDRGVELWPVDRFAGSVDDIVRWCARHAPTGHPLLRYFLATGDWRSAAINGALFGFFAYLTYDATAYAVIRGFDPVLALIDVAWGSVLGAAASTVTVLALRTIPST